MTYQSFEATPMIGALGAEISGVDLTQPIKETTASELLDAFKQYQLLVFHDQPVSIDQQKEFGRIFGDLHIHPFYPAIEGHPEVIEFIKEPEDKVNAGGGWHTDLTCLKKPPKGGLLHLKQVPESGGDTLFADMCAAYDALSPKMQVFLDGLEAIHTSIKVYGSQGKYSTDKEASPPQYHKHPVVCTHPESGRRFLYVNRAYTLFIKGLSNAESTHLLEFIYQHCVKGEFVTRLRWKKDTVALWDNRSTQHHALNDYHGMRRWAVRVTVAGKRPGPSISD